ncbi:MAG: N-acetylmuramoyl-L-alanine amidase [Myxococcota bacterium]
MRHLVALAAVAALLSGGPVWAGKADDAYEAAKASYLALKKDEQRRQLRHHWQNVARKFEAVARKHPKSERAPEALFMAGQLNNELSRISGRDEDVAEAEDSYRRLIAGWPKHRLTDDATLALAKLLADRRGDSSGARALLEAGLASAKDQKSAMQRLLTALPKATPPSKSSSPARAPSATEARAQAPAGREEGPQGKSPGVVAKSPQADFEKDIHPAEPAAREAAADDARASKANAEKGDGAGGRASKQALGKGRPDARASTGGAGKGEAREGPGEKVDSNGDAGANSAREVARTSDADEGESSRAGGRRAAGKTARADEGAEAATPGTAESAGARAAPGTQAAKGGAKAGALKGDLATKAPTPELSLAEAIRRATSPLARLNGLPADEAPQARRSPVLRPAEAVEAEAGDEVLDEAEDSPLASLQERLRDVRVGPRPGETAEAKSRFSKLAKGEASAELTLAQQLGLKVKRVIVDAGHGGHDTGAIGKNGTREKDVSLAIAKKLAAKLEELGLEVVLTRDDDTYVKLEDRTRLANREKGDLFISVHCNAAPSSKLRGIETYSLNTSSNRYAIRLAARENATTERGVGDLQYILADLATKANTGESTRLAERVQQTLVRNLSGSYKNVKNLGHKEALFFVLLGARMPAVLVETSFLSNEEEEARLADDAYQQAVADSIAEAVQGFLDERNRVAQVD